jgi:FtsH-binding integral membrane protein
MASEKMRRPDRDDSGGQSDMQRKVYLRFAAMILTAMVVMYWVMFFGSWEWSHVRWSQSRMFMALAMGATMGLVMLAWMLNMYKNMMANIIVVGLSVLVLVVGVFLDRSQTTVDDTAFMRAMIPHHSLAITRSERFNVDDVRVCELAVAISEAQRREILEMDWLIDDIAQNGIAATLEEADARPVPDFDWAAARDCPTG